jgi:hypothetical protein
MKRLALALMWLTLWCDLCLILGVSFTGSYGNTKVAALIRVGDFFVDSHSRGGASFLVFIAAWTGALAIGGLWAFRKSRLHPVLPTS